MTTTAAERWQRETRRALNFASAVNRGRGRRASGRICIQYGRVVFRACRSLPYGRSLNANARLCHRVDSVYLAWAGGQVAGTLARWRCGAQSNHYALLAVAADDMAACEVCDAVYRRSDRSGGR